jgi:Kef-type K+ transport system membrane component KefB
LPKHLNLILKVDFSQIALLIVVAGVFGVIAQYLKQPLLVGYLFAGIFLASLGVIQNGEDMSGLGQIGVTLLLFLLGLEMNIRDLPSIGKIAFFCGIAQIIVTSLIGVIVATVFGLTLLQSAYIAVAISFSSTVIGVKLLSEKKDLGSLYGKLTVGILLVQDIVAIVILMFLTSVGKSGQTSIDYVFVAVKGIFLFTLVALFSKKVIPYIFEKIVSNSHELTFIVSIAWALGVASFVKGTLGFTLEIGGFLAGISLSNIHEHVQIAGRTRNLRDFFLTLFFLLLGMQVVFERSLLTLIPIALIFSLIVLSVKPMVVMILLELFGYKRRTAFLSGLTLSSASEFSLILASVGLTLGHLDAKNASLITLIGVITMTLSTYLISGEEKIYKLLKPFIGLFERRVNLESGTQIDYNFSDHVVLVGCDRTGNQLLDYFRKKNINYIVIDFNPKVYGNLTAEKVPVIFGDIGDHEVMELASIRRARMVISTVPSVIDNLALLEYIKAGGPKTIMTSQRRSEALRLYEKGATYVIVPEVVAGEHIRHLLRVYGTKGTRLTDAGKSHFSKVIFS